MKKFLHMEDNGDGTMTMTASLDGENEQTFLMPMGFDEALGFMLTSAPTMEHVAEVSSHLVAIPNEVGDQ